MEVKKGVSKGVIISCIIIVFLVVSIVGGAFYIYYGTPEEVHQETLDGGKIALSYADEENLFFLENLIPTSDLVGSVYDRADLFFDFTVNVDIEEANNIEYEVLFVKDDTVSTAMNTNIKIYLEKEENGNYVKVAGPEIFTSNVEDSELGNSVMSLYKTKRESNGNDNYRVRLWLSDTAVVEPNEIQNFGIKVALQGKAK